jgi:hypothetical protein
MVGKKYLSSFAKEIRTFRRKDSSGKHIELYEIFRNKGACPAGWKFEPNE